MFPLIRVLVGLELNFFRLLFSFTLSLFCGYSAVSVLILSRRIKTDNALTFLYSERPPAYLISYPAGPGIFQD